MGSDSIPDWKDVCRQGAETVGCAMALHMVLHVETYDERATSELMKYLQKELGLSARDLPACLQSELTAAQATWRSAKRARCEKCRRTLCAGQLPALTAASGPGPKHQGCKTQDHAKA